MVLTQSYFLLVSISHQRFLCLSGWTFTVAVRLPSWLLASSQLSYQKLTIVSVHEVFIDFLTLDRCFISCYSIFLDRIDNFLTCFVFWKISKGMFQTLPFAGSASATLISYFSAFSGHTANCLHQMNRMIWTFAVLVVVIIPSFRHLMKRRTKNEPRLAVL